MAGNKKERYYDSFVEMSSFSCDAALYLKEILEDYNPDELDAHIEKMHSIEHDGDVSRHTMTKLLAKEFITPIEREDIMALAEQIDQVTDKIEDVLLRLYMFDVREIRTDAIMIADVIVTCTEAMRDALTEFHNFKKSRTLADKIIEINRLEEEGDRMYQSAVRNAFTDGNLDAKTMFSWNTVYDYMEDVCDATEDVADVIEGVIMKNT
ncbi:MAG: DUF47 family protein [Clostridiales Family XIII bacterium]|jgi:predicted phosphate transport protein (TIGR00153 family)|nr:DUF47 family protein [Clostridiales Family XIII bacterium]